MVRKISSYSFHSIFLIFSKLHIVFIDDANNCQINITFAQPQTLLIDIRRKYRHHIILDFLENAIVARCRLINQPSLERYPREKSERRN